MLLAFRCGTRTLRMLLLAMFVLAVGAPASALPPSAAFSADAFDVGMGYLQSHRAALGLEADDLEESRSRVS